MAQISFLACLIAGAMLSLVIARVTIPPAAWLSVVLLLHASRSVPIWTGAVWLWLALYVALIVGNRGLLPIPGPVYFTTVAAVTTAVVLPFVVDRAAIGWPGPASTLVFPVALVTSEFLRSRLTPGATFGSIAYTQNGYLALMQLASVVGIWGITFVIAWGASTFDLAWRSDFVWSAIRAPVLIFAVTFAAIVIAGGIRLAAAPTSRRTLRVAAVNGPLDLFLPGEITRIAEGRLAATDGPPMDDKLRQLQRWFLESSRREARAGASLIAWPEQSLLILEQDEPTFIAGAQALAADEGVYLAMGLATIHPGSPRPFENKVVLIDPSGRTVISYLKSHPVAGWEAGIMRPGDGRLPVAVTPMGRLAAAICHDADFPEFIRQAARGSADLLVVPVNDWAEIKDVHLRMHAFRAIETGVPLVRAAASGISAAFDPWGRVLGVSDYFATGDRTLTVQVPIGRIPTFYAWTGDLFAWLCVAGTGLALALAFGRGL